MCDSIELPDGFIHYNLGNEEKCLCCYTQSEIFEYIGSKLPKIDFDQIVVIERNCFGWYVKVQSTNEEKNMD